MAPIRVSLSLINFLLYLLDKLLGQPKSLIIAKHFYSICSVQALYTQ